MQIHSDFTIPQPETDIRTRTCDNGLVIGLCRINGVSCIGASVEDVAAAITKAVISNHYARIKRLES